MIAPLLPTTFLVIKADQGKKEAEAEGKLRG